MKLQYNVQSGINREFRKLTLLVLLAMVFMDHMMPVMDGMEALQVIREKGLCERIPVIVLTANAVAGEKQEYLEAGFDDAGRALNC